MRNKPLFSWQHPLIELNRISMCLFNIRSWNVHLEHFLSDKIYSTYSSLFFFTETNINDSPEKHIDEILDYWKDICKNSHRGLAHNDPNHDGYYQKAFIMMISEGYCHQ